MPKNKQPMVRYMELDRCFRDTRKQYHMDDLVEAVNKVLENYNGTSVSERQIREDIRFMQRDAGWGIKLRNWMDGHQKIYRYVDTNFCIQEQLLTQREAQLLGDAVQVLSRFEGLPQIDWMDELLARLRIIHPYQLRQNNGRWVLVGKEERQMPRLAYVMLPLDRIDDVEVTTEEIKWKREDLGIDSYLKDVVGTSVNPESKLEHVVLKVGYPDAEYLESKPLHPSQEVLSRDEQSMTFGLDVVLNYELEMKIVAFLRHGEILEPGFLRDKLGAGQ